MRDERSELRKDGAHMRGLPSGYFVIEISVITA